MTVCTLLTDFGTADYYVAAVKGVLLWRAPGASLVDLGHELAPGDVEGGAWLLAAAAPWFPAGTVHLAVVDPGVGGERRIVAAGAGGALWVGPDNGLLAPAVEAAAERSGGGAEWREVTRQGLFLPGPGATFHGRDRFAPAAAWLAAGGVLAELGPAIDDPIRLELPAPRCDGPPGTAGTELRGRVTWIDRFGNLVTDLPAAWLGDRPCRAEVEGGERPSEEAGGERPRGNVATGGATEHRAGHYREIPRGEAAVLTGSLGTLELSLDGDSLARRWRVRRGAAVTVRLR